MADVTITIDADDQSQQAFNQVFEDLKRLEDQIEALADTEARAARESESEVEKSEREKERIRRKANQDQITFVKTFNRQQQKAEEDAVKASAKAVRDANAAAKALYSERSKEFNRILRESVIISEQAAREIANDFSDIEGSLTKAITAYRRGQREAEKFYKEQEQAASETVKVARQSRRTFSDLFHNISNGIFIFRELQFTLGRVVKSIIDVTAQTQTMRATLRVTETDVKGVTRELIDLNRTLIGIEIDTLLRGFTQFRVAGASIKEAQTFLSGVAKATAELGKSWEESSRIIEQLNQSYSQNIAHGQDLRTIFRELPQIVHAATEALGYTITNWKDFGDAAQAAGIDIREAWRLTLTELNRTSIGADPNIWASQFEIFTENVDGLQRAIGDEFVPALTDALRSINEWLRSGGIETLSSGFVSLTRSMLPATVGIGAFFGSRGVRGGIPHVRNAIDRLREMQSTFGQFNSGISSAVFNTGRWRDSLLIASRNAANANAEVAAFTQNNKYSSQELEANAKRASELNDQMKSVNAQFRNFGSIVKGTLIDIGVSASIALIIAAWQDHNRQVKAAERLIQEVKDSYTSSLDSILTAVKDLNNINLDNVSRELERVLRDIADARKQLSEVGTGFFSAINPFDNSAIRSQERSLTEHINNLEQNEQLIRAAISGASQNEIARAQSVLQSQIRNTRSELDKEREVLQRLGQDVLDHNKEIQKYQASLGRFAPLLNLRKDLRPRDYTKELREQQAVISEMQSDLQRLLNLQKRFESVTQPNALVPGQTPISLIDLDRAQADVEDAQFALNRALEAGNITHITRQYRLTADALVEEAKLRRQHAQQTITDAEALARELFRINRDLIIATRNANQSVSGDLSAIGLAAQPTFDAFTKGFGEIDTALKSFRRGVRDAATSSRAGFGDIISNARDALIPLQSENLGTEFARSQRIGPVGTEFLAHAKAYAETLREIGEREEYIALQRQQFAVDPLRQIGTGPDVSESREQREQERQLAFESNQYILGLVNKRLNDEARATREHIAQTFDYYRQGAAHISNLAFSVAFNREQSFKETAIEFVKQSAIIIAQSVIEHQLRLAQMRREQEELRKIAEARKQAYTDIVSGNDPPGSVSNILQSDAIASAANLAGNALGIPGLGEIVKVVQTLAPIIENTIQIGPNEARKIGDYQNSLKKQGRNN